VYLLCISTRFVVESLFPSSLQFRLLFLCIAPSCIFSDPLIYAWIPAVTKTKDMYGFYKSNETRCRSPGSFASAWPELIIACDVRGRGLLQIDRQTEGQDRHHNRVTYCVFRLYRRVRKKYGNSSQGQRPRSHVTNFQPLSAFTVFHIPTKLHQFWSVVFEILCGQTNTQTHTHTHTDAAKAILVCSIIKQYLFAAYVLQLTYR